MTKPLFAAEKAAGQPVAEAGRKRVEAGGGFHQARAVDFAHRAVEGSADAGGKRLRIGQPEGAERFLVVAARVGMVEKAVCIGPGLTLVMMTPLPMSSSRKALV